MNFSRSIETSIMFQSFFKKGYSSSLTLLRLLNNQYSDIICPKCVRKKKKPLIISGFCRGGRIRTYDLHIPNVARYRATLHPDWCHSDTGHKYTLKSVFVKTFLKKKLKAPINIFSSTPSVHFIKPELRFYFYL